MADQHAAHTETSVATGTTGHPVEALATDDLFSASDISGFDADDQHAGRIIGKMLALFFLYTVFAMAVVGWWTWQVAVGD